jgi:hypothetical protein
MTVAHASAGASRTCPHCKATFLQRTFSHPICRHLLKFNSPAFQPRRQFTICPLLVEGTLAHHEVKEPLQYQILMEVRDEAGKLVSRECASVLESCAQANGECFL